MTNHAKDNLPKTSILKEEGSGYVHVKTITGLPYGVPKFNSIVDIPQYSKVKCFDISYSGSDSNKTVREVKLVIE